MGAWMLPLGVTTGSVTMESQFTAFPESEDPHLLLSTACLFVGVCPGDYSTQLPELYARVHPEAPGILVEEENNLIISL